MNLVYQDWAEYLSDCSIGAIKFAIEKSRGMKHPPNQGEFRDMCREYSPADNVLKLARKITPEQQAKNRERLEGIKSMLAKKLSVNG